MNKYQQKWHLKKGDAISFSNRGKVYKGKFYRWWDGYLLVHTEGHCWRVIPYNIQSVRGEKRNRCLPKVEKGQ